MVFFFGVTQTELIGILHIMSSIDLSLLQTLQQHITPWLTVVMNISSGLLNPEIVLPTISVVLLLLVWRHKRWQEIVLLLIMAGNLLTIVVKPIAHRPRPNETQAIILDHQSNYSMPSGHAAAAMTIGGAVILMAHHRRRASRWLVAGVSFGIVLVGVSRVYLGAHWPSDVMVGFAIGFGWLTLIWKFVRPWLVRRWPPSTTATGT